MPEGWRKAGVAPAFKKGKEEDLGSYRLVSLISVPGKVMELLILDVISKRLEERRLPGLNMDSLRENCAWPIWQPSVMPWQLVNGRAVGVVYLGFSKALMLPPLLVSWGGVG